MPVSIHEIVLISGKGGTGKTSLTASLVPFMDNIVLADCDVDAPDLHILLKPETTETEDFIGTRKAVCNPATCTDCGKCLDLCKFKAISSPCEIDPSRCEGCGVCAEFCPEKAISMQDWKVGTVSHSDTAYGPMVHARLIPGEETSGKLVAKVRLEARERAEKAGSGIILIDGPPGIGCNVISAVTGTDTAVIVTEPTRSGLHDLERAAEVAARFSKRVFVVINKYDLAPDISLQIEQLCSKTGMEPALKLPFDNVMVEAITERKIPALAAEKLFLDARWEEFVQKISGME